VDSFLNTQLNTFHTNRNIDANAIDHNIEHLPKTDILDIILGDVFSFATHN
ncbi:2634_t:CDS:1, partial [Funneliformis geosporum]